MVLMIAVWLTLATSIIKTLYKVKTNKLYDSKGNHLNSKDFSTLCVFAIMAFLLIQMIGLGVYDHPTNVALGLFP